MPLEIATCRRIVFKDRKNVYVFHLNAIDHETWDTYFRANVLEQSNDNGEVVTFTETTSARLALLSKVLACVEGYRVPGGGSLASVDNWQEKIPVGHREAVADLLFDVAVDTSAESLPEMLGLQEVVLRATWSSLPDGESNLSYGGLRHTFRTPTVEHQRLYRRESSRSRVVGSRGGKTVVQSVQPTLVKLYDELIDSVDGYVLYSKPFEDRDAIIRNMDAYHKVFAAGLLFNPPIPDVEQAA